VRCSFYIYALSAPRGRCREGLIGGIARTHEPQIHLGMCAMAKLLHCYLAMTPARELFAQVQAVDSAWATVEWQSLFVRRVLRHPIAAV
jgi:hypothetical protein